MKHSKRYISLVLALTLILAACANKNPDTETTPATTEISALETTMPSTNSATDSSEPTASSEAATVPTVSNETVPQSSSQATQPSGEETQPTPPPTTKPAQINTGSAETQPATSPAPVPTEAPKDYTLSISKSSVTLEVGGTTTLTATYTGNGSLTWSSSDSSVATVSNGTVTAKKAGTAYITVTDGTKSPQCKVTVNAPATAPTTQPSAELNISVTTKTILAGQTYQVEYSYTGNKALTWTSDNPSAATVNSSGLVTGVSAGYALIKVTDGTLTKRCTVIVEEAPAVKTTEIKFYATDGPFYNGVTKYVGDYLWFIVYNYPEGGTTKIDVTSSNSSVVSVSYSGSNYGLSIGTAITLNFNSAGSATITLTSGDGAVTQSYTINVKGSYPFGANGQLSPEDFARYATQVMCCNGFTETTCGSWRQFSLPASELTFSRAVQIGQGLVHDWWPNGCRYCQIVYIGLDENGNYQFHECWG